MDNKNSNNNNNSNKPNNKVNLPKFNLNWMYMIIALMLLGLWWGSDSKGVGSKNVTYSEFQDYVRNGYVSKVLGYEDKSIEAYLKPTAVGAVFGADSTKVGRNPVITSRTPSTDKLEEFLQTEKEAGHFDGTSDYPPKSDIFPAILIQILPLVLLVALWIFFMRRMSGGGSGGPGGVFNVGKSKAQLFEKGGAIKVTFKDVAGLAEAKQEVEEIVEFLKEPQKYTDLGGKIPKGALLVGPPGTGKTLLAKAVAGEAGVPFFSISGSNFVEMFVGVGASRVRDLFEQAKRNAPCIIFIDEIDAVARRRGTGLGGGHDEREQTLNQMLVEMDGFGVNEGIIVMAATNRVDILDPAILRPGRFDRKVAVGRPDVKGREEILKVHSKEKPLSEDVDLRRVAQTTAGFTGADLENLMNEAAIISARDNRRFIRQADIDKAFVKVGIGAEKKSRVISEKDKKITAYHEAGHAILFHVLPDVGPVHTVSIIPTGVGAAGYTMPLPEKDEMFNTKGKMLQNIMVDLGGRIAEEIIFKDVTTGASQDIKQASKLARAMVTQYGMSDRVGMIQYGSDEDEVFIGRDLAHTKSYGNEIADVIDEEVKRIVDECYTKAKNIILEHEDVLHSCAALLIEKEKIGQEEFEALFKNHEPVMHNDGEM